MKKLGLKIREKPHQAGVEIKIYDFRRCKIKEKT